MVQCYSFPVSTVLNRVSIRSAVLVGYTNVTADHAMPSSLTIGCIALRRCGLNSFIKVYYKCTNRSGLISASLPTVAIVPFEDELLN